MSKSLEPKHPVTNIGENTSSPIDFNIDGTERAIRPSQCFIQINASLIGKKTVVTPATSTSTATTVRTDVIENRVHCGIINNIGHALFSKMSLKIGNREISSIADYPYVSYINTRLNFNKSNLDSYARLSGWLADKPVVAEINNTDSTADGTLKKRKAWFGRTNNNIDLVIQPFLPIFMMDKVILPFIPISVRLERVTNPHFYLQFPDPLVNETVDYRIQINSAVFYTQYLELTPEYSIGLEKMLTRQTKPAIYKMTEPQILVYNVPPQLSLFSVNNLFNGSLPEKILIMFVTSAAYNGNNLLNPFNFTNADIRNIGLFRNGVPYPHPVIDINFNQKNYAIAYYNTLTALQAPSPAGPCLTLDEFVTGTTIFAFDTSPDSSGIQMSTLTNRTTNIRLEVKFGTAPVEPLVCLVYYERELRVAVDGQRNVSTEILF